MAKQDQVSKLLKTVIFNELSKASPNKKLAESAQKILKVWEE